MQHLLLPPEQILKFLEDKGALFAGSICGGGGGSGSGSSGAGGAGTGGGGGGKKRKRTESDEQVEPGERLGLAR